MLSLECRASRYSLHSKQNEDLRKSLAEQPKAKSAWNRGDISEAQNMESEQILPSENDDEVLFICSTPRRRVGRRPRDNPTRINNENCQPIRHSKRATSAECALAFPEGRSENEELGNTFGPGRIKAQWHSQELGRVVSQPALKKALQLSIRPGSTASEPVSAPGTLLARNQTPQLGPRFTVRNPAVTDYSTKAKPLRTESLTRKRQVDVDNSAHVSSKKSRIPAKTPSKLTKSRSIVESHCYTVSARPFSIPPTSKMLINPKTGLGQHSYQNSKLQSRIEPSDVMNQVGLLPALQGPDCFLHRVGSPPVAFKASGTEILHDSLALNPSSADSPTPLSFTHWTPIPPYHPPNSAFIRKQDVLISLPCIDIPGTSVQNGILTDGPSGTNKLCPSRRRSRLTCMSSQGRSPDRTKVESQIPSSMIFSPRFYATSHLQANPNVNSMEPALVENNSPSGPSHSQWLPTNHLAHVDSKPGPSGSRPTTALPMPLHPLPGSAETYSASRRILQSMPIAVTQHASILSALHETRAVPVSAPHSGPWPELNQPIQSANCPFAQPSYPQILLFDILQTSQATFPFAKVAERHNVSRKVVFDIFRAVVERPFLQVARNIGPPLMNDERDHRKAPGQQCNAARKTSLQARPVQHRLSSACGPSNEKL